MTKTNKGTRKKERIRTKKQRKHEKSYHRKEENLTKQTHQFRKPFLKRGRRVGFGRCRICGEYLPKNVREFYDNERRLEITETRVLCDYHGKTIINEIKIKTE